MGSYDGAETCELVGSYLLSQLPETIDLGLYRDDGLGISRPNTAGYRPNKEANMQSVYQQQPKDHNRGK